MIGSPPKSLAARAAILLILAFCGASAAGADEVVAPDVLLGHRVGADYKLARWEKIVDYFRHVGEHSDRVSIRDLGRTSEGLPMILAEISSPETIAAADRHRVAQRKIADPRLIPDEQQERQLVADSKVVILVNCNLHSTEVASSQMAMELLYDLATGDSPRVSEILERTIVLLVPSANPDGLNMVVDWYERSRDQPWEGTGMPWIYQKYAGHDNNRDWFMLNLQETRNLTRVLYEQWFPTIVYDVHQMGNRGARLFVPPFHDPKNANVHPLIDQTLLIIGGHMAAELAREGKQGVVHGAIYDNWWAGGFRTTPYRHNMVGILTEAASPLIATPVFQRKSELRGGSRGMPSYEQATNFPDPWPGGWWRLRDVVEYEKLACMSLFTFAARYHDMLQENYVRMGREAVERGKTEPPFAWLVPAEQRDPKSAARMLEILHATGIEIHRADAPFTADGIEYPEGTHVLYCAQPYRAHLNDMMERQTYPDRARFPGGPAEAPYDIAGWTLPLQMGVRHVAVAAPFECDATRLDTIAAPAGAINGPADAEHYLVTAMMNDDFRLLNRLHDGAFPVRVYTGGTPWKLDDGLAVPPGSWVVDDAPRLRGTPGLCEGLSTQLIGLGPLGDEVKAELHEVQRPRLALYQSWTANMDEGWTRMVLERFEFDYDTLHNAGIRAGNLHQRYDCVLLPSQSVRSLLDGRADDTTADPYTGGIGDVGVVALQDFVQAGGTLVCIDESCNLPLDRFNIPVKNILNGKDTNEFYCPGSLLRVAVNPEHPLCYGMPTWISGYFRRSQAFELTEKDPKNGPRDPAARFPATVAARYSDTVLLESGWIRGADLIADKPAVVEVQYGAGRIILLGFRIQHRAQPHGTFRLLFNAIMRSSGE